MLLIVAALRDVAVRQLPNWIPLALILLAVPIRLATGNLLAGVATGLSAFLVLIMLWRSGVLGRGDVKLWAATSLLMTPGLMTQADFSLRVVLIGEVVALAYLAMRLVARPALRHRSLAGIIARLGGIELWRATRGAPLPYAVAISAAGLISLWTQHG